MDDLDMMMSDRQLALAELPLPANPQARTKAVKKIQHIKKRPAQGTKAVKKIQHIERKPAQAKAVKKPTSTNAKFSNPDTTKLTSGMPGHYTGHNLLSGAAIVPCVPLTLGSDCAGLCSEGVALELLGISHKHVFAAESNPQVQKLIRTMHGDSIEYFDNVVTRDNAAVPQVQLYVFGAPCQPWSPAGRGKGLEDERGQVLMHCLRYIKDKLPTLVLMENSHFLASTKVSSFNSIT